MPAEPAAALRTVILGGRPLTLRYMTPADVPAILEFARALPTHDLLFLRRDITQVEEVTAWAQEILVGTMATILAVDEEGRIGGYSAVARTPYSWMRHIAELRVLVSEAFRSQGLGRMLVAEAFRIAVDMGVVRMIAQMTIDQQGALQTFRRLGFESMAILPDHVMDRDGKTYDLVVMRQDVTRFRATLDSLSEGDRPAR